MRILAPISLGELIDKITILELKQELITDTDKLININYELSELNNILADLLILTPLNDEREALKAVNRQLWDIENFKRECEGNGRFDRAFIEAGREAYLKNNIRTSLKRSINIKSGSTIVEEKSYD